MKSITLDDGSLFPQFGLGTWQADPGEVYKAVRYAIEIGYNHLDCAAIYQNEAEIGKAIHDALKAGDIKREDLWVTSKLWNDSHLKEDVRPAIEKTLSDLQLDYLDLYLIHWPVAVKKGVIFAKERSEYLTPEEAPVETTFEEMVKLKEAGLTRHVGVSNMGPKWLERLTKEVEKPQVVQVEAHPYLPQNELLDYCKKHQIAFTAYTPLGPRQRPGKTDADPSLLENEDIRAIADHHLIIDRNNYDDHYQSTPAQILISWGLHRGTAVIPKSANPARIKQNLDANKIHLSEEEINIINALKTDHRFIDGSFFTGPESPYTVEGIYS